MFFVRCYRKGAANREQPITEWDNCPNLNDFVSCAKPMVRKIHLFQRGKGIRGMKSQ